MNKKQNNAKGITLVALVITIIVLVILVGVTLSVAINTGLIENSKTAVAKYETEQAKEQQHVQNVLEEVEKYNGTGGKTIAELYDGVNDPEADGYVETAMHIGDYVDYDAGKWTTTVEVPTENEPFTFGGYTAEQSRNTNYTGSSSTYVGWRIWDISEDKSTITLISAGCPEAYYHPEGENYGYNSEKILTGETSGTIAEGQLDEPRDWSDYLNKYASSARVLENSDIYPWKNKYINYDDDFSYPANDDDKLISVLMNGDLFWLVLPDSGGHLSYMDPTDRWSYSDYDFAAGVRILVSLKPNAKFDKSTDTVSHDGFTYNKWLIK